MTWPVEQLTLTCDRTGVRHAISVGLPIRHRSLESAPLLLCFDAPWMFGTVLEATRIMSMSGEAPEAVVVGHGFADESMGEYLRQRARWYTPTPWVPPVETGVKGVTADECGRAEAMLDFVRDQLLPTVMADHVAGLTIDQRWLIGHSFGALFGLRVLLTAGHLFGRWLLASPSIWWDDRAILELESQRSAAGVVLDAHLFTSYGQREAEPPPGYAFNMGQNVEELVARLRSRGHDRLRLTHRVLEDADHSSSIGAAVGHGLRALSAQD